jgi:hypothetical protein
MSEEFKVYESILYVDSCDVYKASIDEKINENEYIISGKYFRDKRVNKRDLFKITEIDMAANKALKTLKKYYEHEVERHKRLLLNATIGKVTVYE